MQYTRRPSGAAGEEALITYLDKGRLQAADKKHMEPLYA
jgi:hypothetical protein